MGRGEILGMGKTNLSRNTDGEMSAENKKECESCRHYSQKVVHYVREKLITPVCAKEKRECWFGTVCELFEKKEELNAG